MISLDEISFYRPYPKLPVRPSLPFKTPLATPKSLPSHHPLPQKPISQTRPHPLSPCRPPLSRQGSAPTSSRPQSTPPVPPCANEFDLALADFDNMAATGARTMAMAAESGGSGDLSENPTRPHLGESISSQELLQALSEPCWSDNREENADVASQSIPDSGGQRRLHMVNEDSDDSSDTVPRCAVSVPPPGVHEEDTVRKTVVLGPAGAQHVQSKSCFQSPSSPVREMHDAEEMRPGNGNGGLFGPSDQPDSDRMDVTYPADRSRGSPRSRSALSVGGRNTSPRSAGDAAQIWNPSASTTENIDALDTSRAIERVDGTETPLPEPISPQSLAAGSAVQGNASSRDACTIRESNETVTMTPTCSEDQPKSQHHKKKRGAHRNHKITVVVPPRAQSCHPRPQKSTGQPHRERRKRRRYRSPSLEDDDSDDPDDSDDDDYVDIARHVSDRRHPTKRPRQVPLTSAERPERQNRIRSQLSGLSLPDLDTMSRGTLTCEIFPGQIIYQLSWAVGRESSDGFQETEHLPEQASDSRETSIAPEDDSHTRPRRKGAKKPWTAQEDADLKRLKEEDQLTWSRIKDYFPDREKGAIMVRYHTKLKGRAVVRASLPIPGDDDWDAGSLSSPEGDRQIHQNRQDHRRHSPMAKSSHRYGAPRSRRPVERYSP